MEPNSVSEFMKTVDGWLDRSLEKERATSGTGGRPCADIMESLGLDPEEVRKKLGTKKVVYQTDHRPSYLLKRKEPSMYDGGKKPKNYEAVREWAMRRPDHWFAASEVAKTLKITPPAVGNTLRYMELKGLVERQTHRIGYLWRWKPGGARENVQKKRDEELDNLIKKQAPVKFDG